jgi:hypothetical protein
LLSRRTARNNFLRSLCVPGKLVKDPL